MNHENSQGRKCKYKVTKLTIKGLTHDNVNIAVTSIEFYLTLPRANLSIDKVLDWTIFDLTPAHGPVFWYFKLEGQG